MEGTPTVHPNGRKPSAARSLLKRILPTEFQPPSDTPRRMLAASGYFRLRTWMAARGGAVPDANLYRPLYSPWVGEPAFEHVYHRVRNLSLVSRDRCYVLWRTLQQATHLDGDVLECGVFRGGTALLAAETVTTKEAEKAVHLFDTFEGMPQTTEGIDHFEQGWLGRTSAGDVCTLLEPYPCVQVHAGFMPETFDGLDIPSISWAHVDVDIYQSVRDCIDFIYPRLVRGGYMIFDDYGFPSCTSARRAVDEAFADKPEVPLCLPTGQCLVVKLGSA
ncbi:MAG: TylF/MycF family methyltransferase [bacterium]|jgi:O-methyltransferase|nr:TylF/MycF family methyltransferase [bacterium]